MWGNHAVLYGTCTEGSSLLRYLHEAERDQNYICKKAVKEQATEMRVQQHCLITAEHRSSWKGSASACIYTLQSVSA